MNDYLSRAVDREMSDIPRVRPALPSLFETAESSAIVAAPATESPRESERSRNAHAETIAENSPALAAPLAAVNALWTDAAATPEPPRIAVVTAGKTSAGVVATPVAASTVARSQAEPHSLAEEPQPAEAVVRPTLQAPPKPPLVRALEKVARPVTSSTFARSRANTASGRDSPISPIPRATSGDAKVKLEAPIARLETGDLKAKAEAPSATGSIAPAMRPAVPTVPQVFPAPSRSERAATSRVSRVDASPRAIHITIGRIEVRAVHPPPEPLPQQRPAPVSPKISLDEYLKQRNGDRR